MKEMLKSKISKKVIAWLLVVSMVLPMLPSGIIARAADITEDYHAMEMDEILESDKNLTWVFTGDSITHNSTWTQGMNSYSEWFEQYLYDIKRNDDVVVNTAWGGAQSNHFQLDAGGDKGLNLEKLVTDYNPDVVFIKLGMNDRGKELVIFQEYYEKMLDDIYAKGAENGKKPKIVLISPTPLSGESIDDKPDTMGPSMDSTYRFSVLQKQIADERGLLFCNLWEAFTNEALKLGAEYNRKFFSDPSDGGIHPNAAAHLLMFKSLCKTLEIDFSTSSIFDLEYDDLNSSALYSDDTAIDNYSGDYGNVATDAEEIDKDMPATSEAELLASVDFTTTKTGADGTFSGAKSYDGAKDDEIDLTDETVCNDVLTLEEAKGLGAEFSIIFRAKLAAPLYAKATEQPVLALSRVEGTANKWENGVYVGVPGNGNNLYYKVNSGITSQLNDASARFSNITATNNTVDGNWHTIAIVQGENSFTYYIDGTAVYSKAMYLKNNFQIGDLFTDQTEFKAVLGTFGGKNNGAWNLNANMDYYQFYKGALTSSEVKALAEGGNSVDDSVEMNQSMPELTEKPIASVDFTNVNGSFVYDNADVIDLTDANVCSNPLELADLQSIDKEYTIAFRAKLDPVKNNQPIFYVSTDESKGFGATGHNVFMLGIPGTSNLYFKAADGITDTQKQTAIATLNGTTTNINGAHDAMNNNKWHTVVVVQKTEGMCIYVDGNPYTILNSSDEAITLKESVSSLFPEGTEFDAVIGRYDTTSGNSSWKLQGKFDYWQLYNTALDDNSISTLTGTVITDTDEINKTMPTLAKLLASVDFTTTKTGADGTFSGAKSYDGAKDDEIDLTDASVCNDVLTLEEAKGIGAEFSIIFRAKLAAPLYADATEQPVLALSRTSDAGWSNGLWVGVPGNKNNLYYKVNSGKTSQLSDGSVRFSDITATNNTVDGNWHTIAIVQGENSFTYYIDGTAAYSKAMYLKNNFQIGDLFTDQTEFKAVLGTFGGNNNKPWNLNASMDYYQFYKGALTASQVASLSDASSANQNTVSWSDTLTENNRWVVAGAEQMAGYEGNVVNRSMFRLLDNAMRGATSAQVGLRDIRMINASAPGYTINSMDEAYEEISGKFTTNVLLLLPEVSEVYGTYNQSEHDEKVATYKQAVKDLLAKSKKDGMVNVLWTPLASSDETINGYIDDYAEAIRAIVEEDNSILFFDANKFMNEQMGKNQALKTNWFEEDMHISPLCALDVVYAFYTLMDDEDGIPYYTESGVTYAAIAHRELKSHNLRLTTDSRKFKGEYVRDYIKTTYDIVENTKISIDISNVLNVEKYKDAEIYFAVLPEADAGNYQKNLYFLDMENDVTKDVNIYTFEAPCKNPIIAVYGKVGDLVYRFKDLRVSVDTNATITTPTPTEVCLNNLQVVGAEEIKFSKETKNYEVSLYQYQRNVQVLAEAQTGLTITVDGKPVESGEYSQRIEVSTEEAKTIEVVVSGNSTEETYTLTLKRPEYPDIIITEVMTDGYQYRLGLDKYELIEIYNASGEDIDLRDYSIGYKKDYPNSSLNNGEMLEKWPYYFTGNDTAFQSTSKANATYTGINKITKYSSYWDNGEVDTDAPIPFPADSTMVIWVKYTRQEGDEELVASWNYDTLMTALEDSAFAEEQKTLTVDIDGNKTAVIPKQEQLVVAEVPYGTIGGSQTSRAGKTSEEAQQNFLLEGHGAANEGSQTRSWLFLLKPGAEQAKNGAITETGNDIISASKFVRVATTVNNCSSTDKLSSVFQYDLDRGMSLVKDETYWNSETIGQGHTSDQQGYGNLTSFGAIEYWQKPIDFSDEETPSVIATKSEGENNKGIVTFEVEDDTDIRYVEFYARKKGAEEWSSVLKKDLVLLDGLEADRTLSNQDIYKFTWEFELEEGSDNEVEYYGYLVDGSGKKHELGYQTGTSDSCKIQTELYTKDEVETFRTAGDYPKDQEGYIFAGWYEDDAYQNPLLKTETVPETGAYAKFVPDHILSVKTQVSANLLDGNVDNDATGSIRFVTSVDSLKYNKMGFKVQIQGYDAQLIESNIVDEVLYGVDEQGNDTVELKYKPQTTFCSQSTYFKSLAFYGIPKADFDTKITVTPYWITKDGTTVFGSTVVRTVNQVRTVDWVYVSNEGADSNNGTKTAPYRTLSHALEQVENYGTICFMTDYTEDSTFVWEDHNKDVTIRGYDGNEVKEILDISVVDNDASSTGYQFNINDAVTFADIILKVDATANNTYIYANGNRFKIGEDVIVDGIPRIYGAGAPGTTINSDTNVTLLAGNYKIIYGGGNNCTLNGNTKLYIAGNVNTDADKIDFTKSNAVQIYGGGYKGTVRGNTEVYVAGNVNGGLEFNTAGGERVLLYGAGSSSTVTGSTYVTVEGNAKFTRIYGGGFQGTVMKSAHVSIAGDVNAGVTLTTRDAYNANLYGGSNAGTIGENTIVNVKGNARFTRIYGGGYQNTSEVTGSTNVTVSGNVNSGVDVTNHGHLAALYGGSHQGKVGSSNVTILENARFSFIYGGGHGATDKVSETGSSNVVFGEANAIDSDTQGVKAYGVYGGSREGANGSTKVVVNSGVVAQIFGGSYLYSVTDETSATTDVQLLGGEITRRVYGGCYNECKNYSSSDWIPDYEWVADREGIPLYSVNGYTNVTISNNVKFSWSETDQGVFAGSRYKETFNDETGTIIFVDGAYSTKKGALGRQDSETNLLLGDLQAYNYLVDASAGGKVTAQGSTLQIVPNSANATVSVSDIDSSNLTNNENGTYTLTLPAIGKDDQKTITVKFN